MPTITFNDFRGGLDVRRAPSVSDANKLRVLKNAYVTHGYTLKKRPGLRLAYELTPGTFGLVSSGGKLHTFSDGVVSHGISEVENHQAVHPSAHAVTGASYGENYNGFLYAAVQYANGSTLHHYFDGTSPTRVVDANCPHSPSIAKNGSKIFSVGDETVRFCATNAARDWTTANDAGFLPVGIQASGDSTPTALGQFESFLAVFFEDAIQTWAVGPDPLNHAIQKTAYLGTRYPFAHANMGSDVFFLSQVGFRSVSTANQVGTLQDLDVGSPIDSILRDAMRNHVNPKTVYWRGAGILLSFFGSRIYVYSISRVAKVSAWALWETHLTVDAAAEVDGVMYLRAGNSVYAFDEFVYTDAGVPFEVHIELPYMDCKSPGVLKQFVGVDLVMNGSARLAHRFDPRDTSQISAPLEASGDTRSAGMLPVEIATTNIAPVIKNLTDAEFELAAISYHYNDLTVW